MFFSAIPLVETPKAVYLFGHGTLETQKMGMCCVCGRTLTHPVSVLLGIGPECGEHWWDWERIGGYSEENIAKLRTIIYDMKIDQWIPKSCIKEELETSLQIIIPSEHKMLKPNNNAGHIVPKKTVELVENQKTGEPFLKIIFPFDMNDLALVKSISGRRYHDEGTSKYWTAPASKPAIQALKDAGFVLDENTKILLSGKQFKVKTFTEIKGLKKELYPYQKEGVASIEDHAGRILLGDEMGLGKTPQTLAWLQLHPELRPAIVVCPASLKLNWQQEAFMWMENPKTQILSGTKPNIPLVGEILIINYDILPDWLKVLQRIKPKVVIFDESHLLKNSSAQRTKAAKKLAKQIPHIIAISGTPIINRPIELYNAIQMIDPTIFPEFWRYAQKYCGAKHNGFGWDFNGATNTIELNGILKSTLMIRRMKSDVLKDLPDKRYCFVPMELSNSRDYRKAENDFITYIKETKGNKAAEKAKGAEVLTQIETLKQLAVAGSLSNSIDWIENFLESDGKLVVFADHKFVIDALRKAFPDVSVKLDGSTAMSDRQKAVTEFQNNPAIRLFIGNIKAAGIGLTLTAASNVAILEFPWSPGILDQAIDRVHRIGQKESVTAYYLLAQGTIVEKIAKLLDSKRKVLDAVLDGKITEESSLLSELINEYSKL